MRRPQEFKIAALRDIQRLFPPGVNPFYAGFGNRDTDILAYRTVGVGDGKIFIINPEGEIRQMNTTYRKTYGGMNKLIQEMFPLCRSLSIDTPGTGSRNGLPISTPDAYNDVNYWRTPLGTLTLSDEEEAKKNRSSLGGTKGVTKK
jgi:phosphatidate phosphatase PAH1